LFAIKVQRGGVEQEETLQIGTAQVTNEPLVRGRSAAVCYARVMFGYRG